MLATLASMVEIPEGVWTRPLEIILRKLIRKNAAMRMMAMQCILYEGQLYMRSYDGIHLYCLKKDEVERILEEVHQGICGPYMNGKMLAKKILRMGYYWITMETDCIDFVKSCHDC